MGIVIGQSVLQRRDLRSGLFALSIFVVLSFVLAAFVAPHFEHAYYTLSLPWRGVVVTLLITGISTAAAPAITGTQALKVVRLLGAASFPFFLLHGVAILFVHHKVGAAFAPWALYFAFCWGEAVAITLAFGLATRVVRSTSHRSHSVG